MNSFKAICSIPLVKKSVVGQLAPTRQESVNLFGLQFRNRVGLGAGFDKNAKYLRELQLLGFGFMEIGTVTPLPQAGNEKPRLFRLPKDRALINRMGFNNDGAQAIASRMKAWREAEASTSASEKMLIGGNIGKNKATPNEDAWKDYEICFRALFDWVDYFVVNVSSPNTPGLRALQEKSSLQKILSHLQTINKLHPSPKPLLLKIAPDLTVEQVDDVISLAADLRLDGLVIANTTIDRDNLITSKELVDEIGAGGLSGKPLDKKSTSILKYVSDRLNGSIPLIASGGIFTAADAQKRFEAGASLLQVWTGFIYEGPSIVRKILSRSK